MDKPYYQLSAPEFLLWYSNFIEVNDTNQAELPITAAEITELVTDRNNLQAKLSEVIGAEQTLEALRVELQTMLKVSEGKVSYFNGFYKVKKVVRELLVQMGFKISDGASSPPPNEPTNLSVVPNVAGYTDLKWDKNGNKPNTIYDIEGQFTGSPNWVHIESVNATKYRHSNQQVGKQVVYRVRARRAGQESAWCSPAVAYYQG